MALARNGTLSATARGLRVNHATVARRIASLETLLGRSLFDRRANGYALTVDGKAVLDEARSMDEAALSVLRRLDASTGLADILTTICWANTGLGQQTCGDSTNDEAAN